MHAEKWPNFQLTVALLETHLAVLLNVCLKEYVSSDFEKSDL